MLVVLATVAAAGWAPVEVAPDSRLALSTVGETNFSALDLDKDGRLSASEFVPVSRRVFASWDLDRDGRLSADELFAGLFVAIDRGRSGRLTSIEYSHGWLLWGRGYRMPFQALDRDVDGLVDPAEFRLGLGGAGYFREWRPAPDDAVRWPEFHAELFRTWDRDLDGWIDQREFEAYADAMQTSGR